MDTDLSATSERVTLIGQRLAEFRADRGVVERSILPLATSIDGRTFTFQASLDGLALQTGQYVELEDERGTRLGQILDVRLSTVSAADTGQVDGVSGMMLRMAVGEGTVLDPDPVPFHDARIGPAAQEVVGRWFDEVYAARPHLDVGTLLLAPSVPVSLYTAGFGRHTFVCGQSGSGKTHAVGVLLERLLAQTDRRMVILDPNSDFVRLGDVRAAADPAMAEAYTAAAGSVSVWRAAPHGGPLLRLRLADVDPPARAALLGLDPIADREEYAVLQELLGAQRAGAPLIRGVDGLVSSQAPGARDLGLRAANLGVTQWSVWSGGQGRSLVTELEEPTSRCLVVDLGSLPTVQEQRLIAETVLSTLWRNRHRRQPCLVVIDEAHNVCPAQPADALSAQATGLAVQIAAEGRKFGLQMLTSTQRPQKLHSEVVSQCDNLLLMRLNSVADLAYLRGVFSFVAEPLLDRATTFRLGEGLVAGGYVPHATYVRFGERISEEGGADVVTT